VGTGRDKKQARVKNNSKAEKYRPVPILRVNKDDDLKTLYAKVRKAFTAADLQRYTQDEPMMPAEELLREFEALDRKTRKRKQKRTAR
jgi:hypothetical protein